MVTMAAREFQKMRGGGDIGTIARGMVEEDGLLMEGRGIWDILWDTERTAPVSSTTSESMTSYDEQTSKGG